MKHVAWILGLALLLPGGCDKKREVKAGDETSEGTADKSEQGDKGKPEATKGEADEDKHATAGTDTGAEPAQKVDPSIADLAPLTAEPPSKEAAEKATALNTKALGLHRKKQYEEAVEVYKEALAADPSHALARYNLASMLVTMGKPRVGLAVLAQFRELDCDACKKRLARARTDKEWKPLWDDDAFVELTAATGPVAEVVAFYAASADPRDSGGIEDPMALAALLEPPPGWVRAPELVFRFQEKDKKPVVRKVSPDRIKTRVVEVFVKTPKTSFTATLTANGKTVGSFRGKADETRAETFPEPVIRRLPRAHAARCAGAICGQYPAISPGSKIVISYDTEELAPLEDYCDPPTGQLTTFTRADGEIGPSFDATGWEPLDCTMDEVELAGGRVVAYDSDDETIVLKEKGAEKVLLRVEQVSSVELCPSKERSAVVVRTYDGLGGDCQAAGTWTHQIVSY